MALKADRQIDAVILDYFFNGTVEKGVVVCAGTVGSGVALDNVLNVASVPSTSSGNRPLGLVLQDVVNIDLTRYPINWHKDQANSGDKITILSKGWAVTNQIFGTGGKAGDYAVLASSGQITNMAPGTPTYNEAANPKIGRFRTTQDQAGYAKIYIDL